jgi:hypothetical protein
MPVTYQDIISLPLTQKDIFEAIQKAQQCAFLNNLRQRHPNIAFDCKLRGFIGEIALQHWLATYDICFQQVNYMADITGMDVDFLYVHDKGALNLELKTSLIPDKWRNLQNCLQRGDIKLIRRGRQTIEQLKGDIHLQIYYRQRRSAKDSWLVKQAVDLHYVNENVIYDRLLCRAYLDNIFFVGWIDKPNLIRKLNGISLQESTWQFPGSSRKFWKCNIASEARSPVELIQYLKSFAPADLKHRAA